MQEPGYVPWSCKGGGRSWPGGGFSDDTFNIIIAQQQAAPDNSMVFIPGCTSKLIARNELQSLNN